MSTTPTPQSDQAATTPGRAEELAAFLEGLRYETWPHAIYIEAAALIRAQSAELARVSDIADDVCRRGNAAMDELQKQLNFARAQYVEQRIELLALRALLTKFQKIAHESSTGEEAMNALFDLSEEVDAALNSPTQKSPAL